MGEFVHNIFRQVPFHMEEQVCREEALRRAMLHLGGQGGNRVAHALGGDAGKRGDRTREEDNTMFVRGKLCGGLNLCSG